MATRYNPVTGKWDWYDAGEYPPATEFDPSTGQPLGPAYIQVRDEAQRRIDQAEATGQSTADMPSAAQIASDVVSRGADAAFIQGTDTGVAFGALPTPLTDEGARREMGFTTDASGSPYPSTPTDTATPTDTVLPTDSSTGDGANQAVLDALQALADQLAGTRDELNRIEALRVAQTQAWNDAQVQLQAAGQMTGMMESMAQPGVGLASVFTQRRPPGQQIPLPPELAALLQGRDIPMSGNIPGGPVSITQEQLNSELFRDAVRNMTSKTYNSLGVDPTGLANFTTFGRLAGMDPMRAWQTIGAGMPTQSRLRGSVLV